MPTINRKLSLAVSNTLTAIPPLLGEMAGVRASRATKYLGHPPGKVPMTRRSQIPTMNQKRSIGVSNHRATILLLLGGEGRDEGELSPAKPQTKNAESVPSFSPGLRAQRATLGNNQSGKAAACRAARQRESDVRPPSHPTPNSNQLAFLKQNF
jgi:hypothetical protein